MVHPRSLKFPTETSQDVGLIYLRPNESMEIGLTAHLEQHIHDSFFPEISCSTHAIPFEECIFNSIDCRPLDSDSTCNETNKPQPAIDPFDRGCIPTNCKIEKISARVLSSYPKHYQVVSIVGDIDNKYFRQHYGSVQFKSDNGKRNTLNEFNKQFLEICKSHHFHVQNSLPKGQKSICDIFGEFEKNYDQFYVKLGFERVLIEAVEEVPADTFDKLFIDITSTFGFWMGFSFFTVIEFLSFFMALIRKIMIHNRHHEFDDTPIKKDSQTSRVFL